MSVGLGGCAVRVAGCLAVAASGQGGQTKPKNADCIATPNSSQTPLSAVSFNQGYELDVGNTGIKHGGWEPAGNIGKAVMAAWQKGRRYAGFEKVDQAAANAAAAKTGWAKLL